jgi:hypothetical protein
VKYQISHVFIYIDRDFRVSGTEEIDIGKDNPQWHNYFLCGVKGIQVIHV